MPRSRTTPSLLDSGQAHTTPPELKQSVHSSDDLPFLLSSGTAPQVGTQPAPDHDIPFRGYDRVQRHVDTFFSYSVNDIRVTIT